MNRTQEEKLKQLASELAKDIKTGEDLSALSSQLVKLTVEAALGCFDRLRVNYRSARFCIATSLFFVSCSAKFY